MQMQLLKETLLLSILVTVLVWLNTPVIVYNDVEQRYHSMKVIVRTFIVAFVVIGIYLYLAQSDHSGDDVLQNMIKSDPPF